MVSTQLNGHFREGSIKTAKKEVQCTMSSVQFRSRSTVSDPSNDPTDCRYNSVMHLAGPDAGLTERQLIYVVELDLHI